MEALRRHANVIGRAAARLRYQRGWTGADLVGKLQMLDCYTTRDILASIETQRAPVTDRHLEFLSEVFGYRSVSSSSETPLRRAPAGIHARIERRRRRPGRPRQDREATRRVALAKAP
jgi:transcriptional regulator with XRE-family HTH domain